MPYQPPELANSSSLSFTVVLAEYLKLKKTAAGRDAILTALTPYIETALDLGYNHLVLTA